jgi:HNH endonuclease
MGECDVNGVSGHNFSSLGEVSDLELERSLKQLLVLGARTESQVIAHLAEVEARRLHLRAGYRSLFEYCQVALGFSEFEAVFRISAARTAHKYPLVLELLERRELHLSAIHLLRPHLTAENHRELLHEARHKSKRQIEELLARRFPQADIPTNLRQLPSLSPLSPSRHHLELTVDDAFKRKLEHARDLLSHANPSGDLGVVLERGLDALILQLEKRRFGARERQMKPSSRPQPSNLEQSPQPGSAPARPHIASSVRREVAQRDDHRCSFTAVDGRRCSARAFLQVHHEEAWARGGPDTPDNLKLLCAGHNRLLAEQAFGAERVRQAVEQRRQITRPSQPDTGAPAPRVAESKPSNDARESDAPPIPDKVTRAAPPIPDKVAREAPPIPDKVAREAPPIPDKVA